MSSRKPVSDPFAAQGSPQCPLLDKQIEGAKGFIQSIEGLVTLFKRAESEGYTEYGLWNARGSLSYADVMAAPCQYRCITCKATLHLYGSDRDTSRH